MILKINGVDILPFVKQKGIRWSREDVNSKNANTTMDGMTHRGRITSKRNLQITCMPLSTENASIVLNAIADEYVEVETIDPMNGHVLRTMYNESAPAVFVDIETNLWDGISFLLKER